VEEDYLITKNMNLKQHRQEFYKLLEELLEVKIPDNKIGYISNALKEYAQATNEKYKEKVEILENKIERIKKTQLERQIKKPRKEFKQKPYNIRVWTPEEFNK
jgi:5'-deoxynucleotidase YfbR-like HD superfamily hydrolase